MEFTELFNGQSTIFSPNGRFLACICADCVEVRYADTLLKAFKFECADIVKVIKWSGDSALLLCQGSFTIKIFSVVSGSNIAVLKQPLGHLNQISWVADSRTVLFSEPFLFRIAVWKINVQYGQTIEYINNVQPWAKPNAALSPNGKHLAVIACKVDNDMDTKPEIGSLQNPANKESADELVLYSSISWRKEITINCNGIHRINGVAWSPNSSIVVVWPSDPQQPVLFLSSHTGFIIGKWQSPDKLWAGVLGVEFSPSSQFLTVVGLNSKVHMINCIAWCEELELIHHTSVCSSECEVYQEAPGDDLKNSYFVKVRERPVSISFLSQLGKLSSSKVVWSSGGRYLASCLARAPAVIWIWSCALLFKLCCVIVTKHPVTDFKWDPVQNILAIVDGQDCVALWNADEKILRSLSVCTPVSRLLFQARHLHWRHDGKVMVASSEQNSTILELSSHDQ